MNVGSGLDRKGFLGWELGTPIYLCAYHVPGTYVTNQQHYRKTGTGVARAVWRPPAPFGHAETHIGS